MPPEAQMVTMSATLPGPKSQPRSSEPMERKRGQDIHERYEGEHGEHGKLENAVPDSRPAAGDRGNSPLLSGQTGDAGGNVGLPFRTPRVAMTGIIASPFRSGARFRIAPLW